MMSLIKIAYHPIYKYPLPEGHRFPMEKYEVLKEQLLYEGLFKEADFFYPDAMIDEHLLWTHTTEYLNKLHLQTLTSKEIRAIGFPMTPLLVQRGKHIAQGTYEAALHALDYGCGMNIAGGTHHSFADHGEGFCIFNDIALAANILLKSKKVSKVLIVDLDVHQGNGTASIFANNDHVFTFSMHGEHNYPLRKEKSDLDIGLKNGTSDNEYLNCLSETLPMLIDKHKPQIIFYQSGVDVLKTDKLGKIHISEEGCKHRDEIVFNASYKYQIPIVTSMGGGYSTLLKDVVNAHANTYRIAHHYFG
jgi:acetoin utilization deacetylase AcuC-like enzyme